MLGVTKLQGPPQRLSVLLLINANYPMHCMFLLQLDHLLLATRTSPLTTHTFNLNKYSHCFLNSYPTCTTKLSLPESSKLETISKLCKTLLFCRYSGPNHPPDLTCVNQWPNIQHPWSFPGLYWDFHSPRSISVHVRAVEKQASGLLLYLLWKLTTIEVSYLYNTLGWSGGKNVNHTAVLSCFSLSCSDAQIKPLINQTVH